LDQFEKGGMGPGQRLSMGGKGNTDLCRGTVVPVWGKRTTEDVEAPWGGGGTIHKMKKERTRATGGKRGELVERKNLSDHLGEREVRGGVSSGKKKTPTLNS